MLSSWDIQVSNGKEYALCDVIEAIEHAFGASPQIICKKGSIQELRLCFDKDLKVSSPFALDHLIFLQFITVKYYGREYHQVLLFICLLKVKFAKQNLFIIEALLEYLELKNMVICNNVLYLVELPFLQVWTCNCFLLACHKYVLQKFRLWIFFWTS